MQCYCAASWASTALRSFSPLSARICSATFVPSSYVERPTAFQSAICADMQCYAGVYTVEVVDLSFQSAICADMQCYPVCDVERSQQRPFQSAICADMQCYLELDLDPLPPSVFQSAICADMQCYVYMTVWRAYERA